METNEQPGVVLVQVEPVRIASFEQVISGVGTCTAIPTHQSSITAAVEGLVDKILVAEGTRVKAGQPLIRLDDRLPQKELVEREAARDEFKASLTLLKTLPREPERRQAKLEIERAQVVVELARSVVSRLEPLSRRKEISEQQFYEAKQKLRDSELMLKAAHARVEVLMLGPKPEAIAEIQARIDRADAAVETAKTRLSYFELKAPRPGIVNSILCRPGQLLAVGTVAAEILDPSEIFVTIWLPPGDAREIRPGQTSRVSTAEVKIQPNRRDEPLAGSVAFVGWQASSETGLFPVRVRVSNSAGRLRLGMLVSIEIVVGEVTAALAVPDAAIVSSDAGMTVVVVRDGKAVILHPRVGLRKNGLTQVTVEGLQEGEPVVTQGGYNLPDGTPVEVQRRPAPAKISQP